MNEEFNGQDIKTERVYLTDKNNKGDISAMALLHEIKAQTKRWFIIAMAELAIILAMAGGMLLYFSLPVEEGSTTTQSVDDVDNSGEINQSIGE